MAAEISTPPVSAGEIAAVAREARRLASLGPGASARERCAFFEHKVSVLERIAAHGGLLVDRRMAEEAAVYARAQLDHYRQLAAQAEASDA